MKKAKSITYARLQEISAALASAPAPEPVYSSSEALKEMRPRLIAMKDAGHTNADIVALLAAIGEQVSERQVGLAMRGTADTAKAEKAPRRRSGGAEEKKTSRKEDVGYTITASTPALVDPLGLQSNEVVPVLACIGDADSRIGPHDL